MPKPPFPISRISSKRPITAPGHSASQVAPVFPSGCDCSSCNTSEIAPGRTAGGRGMLMVPDPGPALRLTGRPSLLPFQDLHRGGEAAVHAVERGGKDGDFVPALHRQL